MGNWKELGVVPDSDDEGLEFDSLDLLKDNEPNIPPRHSENPEPDVFPRPDDDVWAVPPSPHTPELPPRHDSSASPCSGSLLRSGSAAHRQDRRTPERLPAPSVGEAGLREDFGPQESVSIIQDRGHMDLSCENNPQDQSSTPLDPPATIGRYRSLRPRKPIQEHPYLLENAQYSIFMKSHGIKPVKASIKEAEPGNRKPEEDSQEQDFRAEEDSQEQDASVEESQSGLVGGELGHAEETQSMQATEARHDRGFDELAFSVSPRTSSPLSDPATGTQESNGHYTATSSMEADDELPSLDDLLRERRNVHRTTSPELFSKAKPHRRGYVVQPAQTPLQKRRSFVLFDVSSPPESPPLLRHSPLRQQPPRQLADAPTDLMTDD